MPVTNIACKKCWRGEETCVATPDRCLKYFVGSLKIECRYVLRNCLIYVMTLARLCTFTSGLIFLPETLPRKILSFTFQQLIWKNSSSHSLHPSYYFLSLQNVPTRNGSLYSTEKVSTAGKSEQMLPHFLSTAGWSSCMDQQRIYFTTVPCNNTTSKILNSKQEKGQHRARIQVYTFIQNTRIAAGQKKVMKCR